MRVTVKNTLSDFFAVRSIFSFIHTIRYPKHDPPTTKPGTNSKVSPGRTEEAPSEEQTPATQTRESPNESPSGHPAATPQKRDAFHDEHPDDAPHHEPYAQPAPHSRASYAVDAPNQP